MALLSRRTALLLGAAALTIPRIALAAAPTDRRFVLVILRGALDGLAAVPPFFDPAYRSLRGALGPAEPGTKENAAIDLDGRFGLHPELGPIAPLFAARELAIVHAVATSYRERSHFDAQNLLENGTTTPGGSAEGWLNRALGLMASPDRRLGLAVGQTTPLVLRGATPVGAWAPQTMPEMNPDFLNLLAQVYRGDKLFETALADGLKSQAMADEVLGDEKMAAQGARGLRGPQAIKTTASAVAKLLASPEGPRVAAIDIGGWDTHTGQNQRLGQMLKALAEGLAALKEGLGPEWRRTLVVVTTEFGRTAAVNGTGGTDHGTASVALLLGGALAGGRVLGTWPGLASNQLYQGRDLAPTTDLRAVLKAALTQHLGLPADGVERVVFPNSRDARALEALVRA